MATSLADADTMVDTARKPGCVLTFNHYLRFARL